jgi:hypothetical protein
LNPENVIEMARAGGALRRIATTSASTRPASGARRPHLLRQPLTATPPLGPWGSGRDLEERVIHGSAATWNVATSPGSSAWAAIRASYVIASTSQA